MKLASSYRGQEGTYRHACHTADCQPQARLVLAQMEASPRGVEVVGMFFFDDTNIILDMGDPIVG